VPGSQAAKYAWVDGLASFQQNLGKGLDPTGDRSYPPWNHVPLPQEIMHGTDAALDRMAYIYFKYTSHIILMKARSKTFSPL